MITYWFFTTRSAWTIYQGDRLYRHGQDFEELYQLFGQLNQQGRCYWGNS